MRPLSSFCSDSRGVAGSAENVLFNSADRPLVRAGVSVISLPFPSCLLSSLSIATSPTLPRSSSLRVCPYLAFDADHETNRVQLKGDPGVDELSKAEVDILQSVFDRFRNYTWKQMRDFCHTLPEYEDVGQGSKRLPFERILLALGKTEAEIQEAERRHIGFRMADMLLAPPYCHIQDWFFNFLMRASTSAALRTFRRGCCGDLLTAREWPMT